MCATSSSVVRIGYFIGCLLVGRRAAVLVADGRERAVPVLAQRLLVGRVGDGADRAGVVEVAREVGVDARAGELLCIGAQRPARDALDRDAVRRLIATRDCLALALAHWCLLRSASAAGCDARSGQSAARPAVL